MADLGLGGAVVVDPPAGPVFTVAPPTGASVDVVPVAGPPGPPGGSGLVIDDNDDGTFTLVEPIS